MNPTPAKNPINQSLAFHGKDGRQWAYCLPHLLEMHYEPAPKGCLRLLFSTEYVVIRGDRLESLWNDLVQGEPDLAGNSPNYGLTSIQTYPYSAETQKG